MNSDRQQERKLLMQELESIQKQIDKFFESENPIDITYSRLQQFLEVTSNSSLPPNRRLIAMAYRLSERTFSNGWQSISCIFRFAAELDSSAINDWLLVAQWWYTAADRFDLQERSTIAHHAEDLAITAWSLTRSILYAQYLGELFYMHPAKEQDTSEFLKLSLKWFRVAQSERSNDRINYKVAICLFELGEWAAALAEFTQVDKEELTRLYYQSDPSVGSKLNSYLDECNRRLKAS